MVTELFKDVNQSDTTIQPAQPSFFLVNYYLHNFSDSA